MDSNFRKATAPVSQGFLFERNNIYYAISNNGNLYNIIFYKDGAEVVFSNIKDYPINRTDTALGKLLSPDEAVANAAFAEITEKLSK